MLREKKRVVAKIKNEINPQPKNDPGKECEYCNLIFLTAAAKKKHKQRHSDLIDQIYKINFNNVENRNSPFLYLNEVKEELEIKFGLFVSRSFYEGLTAGEDQLKAFERVLKLYFFQSYVSDANISIVAYLVVLLHIFSEDFSGPTDKFPRKIPKLMNKFVTEFLEEVQFLRKKPREFVFAFLQEGQTLVDWLFDAHLTESKVQLELQNI